MINYYLSSKQEREIRKLLLKNYNSLDGIGAMIAGSEMNKRYNQLLDDYMTTLFYKNPEKFHDDFVKLDFKETEAQLEFSTLLNTYRFAKPWIRIRKRDFVEELVADYEGESLNYPFGKHIFIDILGKANRSIIDFVKNKEEPIVTFEINIEGIRKITGSIDEHFEVYFDKQIIGFNYKRGITFKFR